MSLSFHGVCHSRVWLPLSLSRTHSNRQNPLSPLPPHTEWVFQQNFHWRLRDSELTVNSNSLLSHISNLFEATSRRLLREKESHVDETKTILPPLPSLQICFPSPSSKQNPCVDNFPLGPSQSTCLVPFLCEHFLSSVVFLPSSSLLRRFSRISLPYPRAIVSMYSNQMLAYCAKVSRVFGGMAGLWWQISVGKCVRSWNVFVLLRLTNWLSCINPAIAQTLRDLKAAVQNLQFKVVWVRVKQFLIFPRFMLLSILHFIFISHKVKQIMENRIEYLFLIEHLF